MREFEVNGYLTLRLENNNTVIYVNNKKFIHCKYLLINRYSAELEELLLLKSVDELEELLDNSMENPNIDQCDISPEVEFWGHCSNLQVWYENNYDTRLLHRNLAFSLLKKLTEAGDPLAKIVFKEEIAKRLDIGHPSVTNYLIEMNYIKFLSREELLSCILGEPDIDILCEIENLMGINLELATEFDSTQKASFTVKKKHISGLYFCLQELEIPDLMFDFPYLKNLYFEFCQLNDLPDSIGHLLSLEELVIFFCKLNKLPKSIGKLINLKILSLGNNNLSKIPNSIGDLKSLEILRLGSNKLKTIPDTISLLKALKILSLDDNQLGRIPKLIGNIFSLEELYICGNQLAKIPDSIGRLKFLKKLNISSNLLKSIPNSIGNLCSLEELYLNNNLLKIIPRSLENLVSLKELYLKSNNLDEKCKLFLTNVKLTKKLPQILSM